MICRHACSLVLAGALGLAALLWPAPASAQVCFNIGSLLVQLEVVGQSGTTFQLGGRFFYDSTTSKVLFGSAQLQGDNTAQFAVVIPAGLVSFALDGTLNPPTYNFGSGTLTPIAASNNSTPGAATFTPAVCP